MNCLAVIFNEFQKNSDYNQEISPYFWNKVNCQGEQYPKADEFPLKNQFLRVDTIPFHTVNSLYIPHHMELRLWSLTNLYAVIKGPALLSDLSAHPLVWNNSDGTECDNTIQSQCGSIVDWEKNKKFSIARYEFKIKRSWKGFLHDRAISSSTLQFMDAPLITNFDALFQKNCTSDTKNNDVDCNCWYEYHEFIHAFPELVNEVDVSLISTTCNKTNQYLPTNSKHMKGTIHDCKHIIQKRLENHSFEYNVADFPCEDFYFPNILDRNSAGNQKNNLNPSIYIITSLFLLCTLLFLFRKLMKKK